MENWKNETPRRLELDIGDMDKTLPVLHALSTELRLNILRELWKGGCSVNELARTLKVPMSTAALNVQILERAGLLECELKPGTRGTVKLCTQRVGSISLNLEDRGISRANVYRFEMPVGCYSTVSGVEPSCGIAFHDYDFGMNDMPGAFYHPCRFEAGLLWMHKGSIQYRFPGVNDPNLDFLEITYEACSETRTYRNDYPSDIYTAVNGVRLGVWRCPGDFGGRRGFQNPEWWTDFNTQFGRLVTWRVDRTGTTLDGARISAVTLSDLNLAAQEYIALDIGVTDENGLTGGLNLFGKGFGDYPQGIIIRAG